MSQPDYRLAAQERQRGDTIAVTLGLVDRLAVTGREYSNDLVVSRDSELTRIVAEAEDRMMDAGSGPAFLISLPSSTEQIRTTLFASPIAAWLPAWQAGETAQSRAGRCRQSPWAIGTSRSTRS